MRTLIFLSVYILICSEILFFLLFKKKSNWYKKRDSILCRADEISQEESLKHRFGPRSTIFWRNYNIKLGFSMFGILHIFSVSFLLPNFDRRYRSKYHVTLLILCDETECKSEVQKKIIALLSLWIWVLLGEDVI